MQVGLTLVANRLLYCPPSPYIRAIQVTRGIDAADHLIVEHVEAGDLVITADVPLAADVMARGGHALSPRGEFYSADTIRGRLAMRDFMDELRASGVETGGPSALDLRDRQLFANQLDRFLSVRISKVP